MFFITTMLYMVVLLYMSLKPAVSTGEGLSARKVLHNLLHVPAYGLLAYLTLQCFQSLKPKACFYAFMLAFAYGALMEVLQSFLPTRTASLGDMLLNAAGAYLTVFWICRQPANYHTNRNQE